MLSAFPEAKEKLVCPLGYPALCRQKIPLEYGLSLMIQSANDLMKHITESLAVLHTSEQNPKEFTTAA
jgi:hypothetical protein